MAAKRTLDQQLEKLVQEAPDSATALATRTIGAVLLATASKLNHDHYFLVTDRANRWQSVTLSNGKVPAKYKTVIYAFADRATANSDRLQSGEKDLLCQQIPLIEILLQSLALNVDSLVFFEEKLQSDLGKEISIRQLYAKCQNYLAQNTSAQNTGIA